MSTFNELNKQKLSRRQLLRSGLHSSIVLGATGATGLLSGCTSKQIAPTFNQASNTPYHFLTKQDEVMVRALLPSIVGYRWPTKIALQKQAFADTLPRVDLFISRMGQFNMSETRKLFDLLQSTPTRVLTTGLWSDWDEISVREVDSFLHAWKNSSFSTLNAAYNGLTDIFAYAWYSNANNTAFAGYDGPPMDVLKSLPQFQEMNAS